MLLRSHFRANYAVYLSSAPNRRRCFPLGYTLADLSNHSSMKLVAQRMRVNNPAPVSQTLRFEDIEFLLSGVRSMKIRRGLWFAIKCWAVVLWEHRDGSGLGRRRCCLWTLRLNFKRRISSTPKYTERAFVRQGCGSLKVLKDKREHSFL